MVERWRKSCRGASDEIVFKRENGEKVSGLVRICHF